jgi:2-haloacid dehalogenase
MHKETLLMTDAGPAPVIVFDLGGVLIDWNPRHLYRKLFDDEAAMERFLSEVCNPDWNICQDAGRPFEQAVAELAVVHPEQRPMIEAYWYRWPEMIAGPIEDAVEVFAELRQAGLELHALTNWSAETFGVARERFEFLTWFRSILVSGEIGLIKPDPRIFELLLERIGRAARDCLYIDDSAPNVAAARALGFDVIHFQDGGQLRAEMGARALVRSAQIDA